MKVKAVMIAIINSIPNAVNCALLKLTTDIFVMKDFLKCKVVNVFDIYMYVHRNIIPNYSQQDATILEFIYFYRCSTCFRRFLHPSSGAHNCTYSVRYCQPILLLAATVEESSIGCIHNIT
jgi:hypothetical protein